MVSSIQLLMKLNCQILFIQGKVHIFILKMRPWLEYVHIKDFKDGKVYPAGEGDGRMPELFAALKATGFDGYLSLEPHLEGGPEAFRRAARVLKMRLDEIGWAHR